MSCFGCSKKYGIFCKEYGCPNCGYSYCAKCLKRPMAVPRHNDKVLNVCLICYDKLSKLQANEKVIDCDALPGVLVTKPTHNGARKSDIIDILDDSPPDLNEILAPISIANNNSSIPSVNASSDIENSEICGNLDSMISKRLQNLKTVDTIGSDEEIRARLSNLNGMPQKNYTHKDLILSTDQRSDQQKMNDLLVQFLGETHLDQRLESERNDSISDIERRLKALRDAPVTGDVSIVKEHSPDINSPSDNEENDETILKRVLEKYTAEARLPTALETELVDSVPPPPAGTTAGDMQELPWCNVCNEDAIYRCKDCDGDLFCAQCYRECHDDDEEYRAHVKVAYTAPPNFKENHF